MRGFLMKGWGSVSGWLPIGIVRPMLEAIPESHLNRTEVFAGRYNSPGLLQNLFAEMDI